MDESKGKSELDDLLEKHVLARRKILRDLPHTYINLTDIDLRLIDTSYFQRLSDIKQLTCQAVYPSAQHTRFEHSLGVMELTREAIEHINVNGYIAPNEKKFRISATLRFNAGIAALLHDVGHCPYSHLGEDQCEKGEIRNGLINALKQRKALSATLETAIGEHNSVHELLSCYLIANQFSAIIETYLGKKMESVDSTDCFDLQLVVRCVLGVRYSQAEAPDFVERNVLVNLINSSTLDMDKLDYIMRDAIYTGISVPKIDTKRLFKNLYVNRAGELVYTDKAIAVLENVIQARDDLYLYVYNHHTAVYSDFLKYYILRRLCSPRTKKTFGKTIFKKKSFFGLKAIENGLVSDSDLFAALKQKYLYLCDDEKFAKTGAQSAEGNELRDELVSIFEQMTERKLLKPLWKNIFEFDTFMQSKFYDDEIRDVLCKRICGTRGIFDQDEAENARFSAEFRSRLAKDVITAETGLGAGDFFIVPRSNKFYSLRSIADIMVYFKTGDWLKMDSDDGEKMPGRYGKRLTNIMPHKDMNARFPAESFYVYIKKDEPISQQAVEKAFIETAVKWATMPASEFCKKCDEEKNNKQAAASVKAAKKEEVCKKTN